MRKWLSLIAAALTVAVVVPALAGAASHRKCSFNLTFLTAPVKASGNPPLSGTETRGATVDGKLCGKQFHGASRLTITYVGPGKPNTVLFAAFGPVGSLRGIAHAVGIRQPDGSASISGSGKITGGTGLYNGAVGSLSATGSTPAHSNVNTLHDTGTVRF
jgi:hypothetical protein